MRYLLAFIICLTYSNYSHASQLQDSFVDTNKCLNSAAVPRGGGESCPRGLAIQRQTAASPQPCTGAAPSRKRSSECLDELPGVAEVSGGQTGGTDCTLMLSRDVFLLIFTTYCNQSDLPSLKVVCKRWSELLKGEGDRFHVETAVALRARKDWGKKPFVRLCMPLEEYPIAPVDDVIRELVKCGAYISLDTEQWKSYDEVDFDLLLSSVKEIRVRGGLAPVSMLALMPPQVEVLEFTPAGNSSEIVSIFSPSPLNAWTGPSLLRVLDTDADLLCLDHFHTLGTLPNLECLKACIGVRDKLEYQLYFSSAEMKRFQSLKNLTLTYGPAYRLSDYDGSKFVVCDWFLGMPVLEQLDFRYLSILNPDVLLLFPNLKVLKCDQCEVLADVPESLLSKFGLEIVGNKLRQARKTSFSGPNPNS